jgi:hypothetical protein
MPAHDADVRRASARLAATERHHPSLDTSHLRRELKAAQAADYIKRVVGAAPPLTQQQRDKLALLLRAPSTVDGGEAA